MLSKMIIVAGLLASATALGQDNPAAATANVGTQPTVAFDASAWRGAGLERVKWLFRVYVARKPSLDEVEAFVQQAVTPDQADATMLSLIQKQGQGGLYADFQATFAKRVDGFVNGTQQAALADGGQPTNQAFGLTGGGKPTVKVRARGKLKPRKTKGLGLDDAPTQASLDAAGDLQGQLDPLVHAATDDTPRCGDASTTAGCFAAWLADWIQPGQSASGPAPQGSTYVALLQAIAASH